MNLDSRYPALNSKQRARIALRAGRVQKHAEDLIAEFESIGADEQDIAAVRSLIQRLQPYYSFGQASLFPEDPNHKEAAE